MLDELDLGNDHVAVEFVAEAKQCLANVIAEERQSENRQDRRRDERFE